MVGTVGQSFRAVFNTNVHNFVEKVNRATPKFLGIRNV